MKPFKIESKWYRLEIQKDDGTWKDAGDVFEESSIGQCRKEMVGVNFWPSKVRMIEHFHAYRPIGKVLDTSKLYK